MLRYLLTSEGLMISGLSLMLVLTQKDSKKYHLSYIVYLLTLLAAALVVIGSFSEMSGLLSSPMRDGINSKFILVLGFIFSAISGYFFVRDDYEHKQEGLMLLLIATLGFSTMVTSDHLLSIYIAMELISFPLYTAVALSGTNFCIEASLKYFIQGSFASTLFLFGVSILYGLHGEAVLNISSQNVQLAELMFSHEKYFILESFALVLMSGTIFFKLGLAPFHFWVSDVYLKARPSFVIFLGTLPKIAFFTLAFKLIPQFFQGVMQYSFDGVLIFIVLISAIWANTIALETKQLGRVMGYSAVVQMSFLILVLLISNDSSNSYNLGIFHLAVYGLTSSIIFGTFAVTKVHLSDRFSELSGYKARHPLMALIVALSLFSLAGIPPFPGFITKFLILKEAVASGYIYTAAAVLLSTVIACAYYIRIIAHLVQCDTHQEIAGITKTGSLHKSEALILILFILLLLVTASPTVLL